MSGKSLDTFLFQSFSREIRQNIINLMENFPKIEENQKNLSHEIINYFANYKVIINNFLSKCDILSSADSMIFFLDIIEYFNQIPLDMAKTNFNFPLFYDEEMKEKSKNSFQLRLCTNYVSHSILTQVFYYLILRTEYKKEHYPLIYSAINQILFHDINEQTSLQLDFINIPKWSVILNSMCKIIPDIIISDAFNHIQSSQNLHSDYHIFIFHLYSFLIYPKEILENFPLISVTFQQLFSILNANRSSSRLLNSANKFIRNFLGYAIQFPQTKELFSLYQEISKFLTKAQNDKYSFNSTLVLFNTLSNGEMPLFSIHSFFTSISRQFPTQPFKILDTVKTFISILNGSSYINFFKIDKIDDNFFRTTPNQKDQKYIQQMLKIIRSNMSQFKQCQRELGLLYCKIMSLDFNWFIRKEMNKLIEPDFFQLNEESVLYFANIILSNESIVFRGSKIRSSKEPIILQFKNLIISLCQKVMDANRIDLFKTKSFIFNTNDFSDSLTSSSLSYEVEQIVDHTSLIPVVPNERDQTIASDFFNEINEILPQKTNFDSFLNDINENQLLFYKMEPIVHSNIENVLSLCLLLASEIELSSPQVFNKIPMYLFSNSSFVSALTIRIIQAFIHVKRDQSVLNSLLTLQILEFEQLYIYGLALVRTVKSLVQCKVGLTVDLANSLLAWQWILLSAPYPMIRDLGLKLAEAVVPILPYDNFPNVHNFIIRHQDEIFQASSNFLLLSFSPESLATERISHFKFNDIAHCNSYLLYYAFFTYALKFFSINEDKFPQLNHTMIVTHAIGMSFINEKKNSQNIINNFFMINLITLRLSTSYTFDKYTSRTQLSHLMKLGYKFIYTSQCDERIFYLYCFSINPALDMKFKLKSSSFSIDTLCFHFRLFITEYFKEFNDTIDFIGLKHININNYQNISRASYLYRIGDLEEEDNDQYEKNNGNHLNGICSIEKALQLIINYFNSYKIVINNMITPIDFVKLVIVSNNILPSSLTNLLIGLDMLFDRMKEKFAIRNSSFFLKGISYSTENHSPLEQPFNPNIWFPFLYNLSTEFSSDFPLILKYGEKALISYLSFIQIPDDYIAQIISDKDQIINKQHGRIWSSLIVSCPSLFLPLFCDILTHHEYSNNLVICDCFKEPSTFINDLEYINNNLHYFDFSKNEFDKNIIPNIGKLLSISFFNFSFETPKTYYFKIIYQISLFGLMMNLAHSNKLIPIIQLILNNYSNSSDIQNPIHLMVELSSVLSEVFGMFTEQFLFHLYNTILKNINNSTNDMALFFRFSIPWFKNISLCNNKIKGIVRNSISICFTSYSFLADIFSMRFKQNDIDTRFSQDPLPKFSQDILDAISENNLWVIVYYILHENIAKSAIIYLSIKYKYALPPYLTQFLLFDFAYFTVVQCNKKDLYHNITSKVLDVFISLLKTHQDLVLPHFHILFVFCFVNQSHKSDFILNEISNFFKQTEFIDCLKFLTQDESHRELIIHESFKWMLSYNNLKESLLAMKIFEYFTNNKLFKSDTDVQEFISDIQNNIKIICLMLSDCSLNLNGSSVYYEFISKFLNLLCDLGSPPIEIAFNLLKCNMEIFSPIFEASLKIVSDNIEKFEDKSNEIFIYLITAELRSTTIELIFSLISKMIKMNFLNSVESFLLLIPYLAVNEECQSYLSEKVGSEKVSLIVNASSKANEESEFLPDFFNDETIQKFSEMVNELIGQISGEKQFLVISFFIRVVTASKYKYFYPIYVIIITLLKTRGSHSSLCSNVFSPFGQFLVKHQNDKKRMNQLVCFIRHYETCDSSIWCEKSRITQFPSVSFNKNRPLSFYKSYPVIRNDFQFIDSNLVDEINSFVLSVQLMRFVNMEKDFFKMRFQTMEKCSNDMINSLFKESGKPVDKLLKTIKEKKIDLNPSDVSKIVKIDCSVFRKIDDIDALID